MISSHNFLVPFHGKTIHAESTFGRNGHVLMLHGGGKDRTVFYKYRDILDTLGFGTTVFDFIGHGETGETFTNLLFLIVRCKQRRLSLLWGRRLQVVWASVWEPIMHFSLVKRCNSDLSSLWFQVSTQHLHIKLSLALISLQ